MEIYNGYEYNDCGVCVNPDKPYAFGKWNSCNFKIKVSETPNGWIYGFRSSHPTGGHGYGCSVPYNPTFPSRSEAIVACAEIIKRDFTNVKGASKAIAELDRIIEMESTQKSQVKQYTIFDYL